MSGRTASPVRGPRDSATTHDTRTREAPAGFAAATTPTVRGALRRGRFWLILSAAAVVGLLAIAIVSGTGGAGGQPYSIDSATPQGSKAVAEVLRGQGVRVESADTLAEAEAAAGTGDATVLLYDPAGYLSPDQLHRVGGLASSLVLLLPGSDVLEGLAPGVAPAGKAAEGVSGEVSCALPAAQRAGAITTDGLAFRDVGGGASDLCFTSFGDSYSVVRMPAPGTPADPSDGAAASGRTVTVLGAADVLTNEGVVGAGNAALALGLLGEKATLVWYLPTAADIEAAGPVDLSALTPDWVTPVLALSIFTFLAAAVWRGRRLGAVVIENLPVTVHSRETMEGRARLYATAGARTRALDALRIGTTTRLCGILGLPRNASVEEVAQAAASVTGEPVSYLRSVLVVTLPRSDAELVALSDRLLALERAVAGSARP